MIRKLLLVHRVNSVWHLESSIGTWFGVLHGGIRALTGRLAAVILPLVKLIITSFFCDAFRVGFRRLSIKGGGVRRWLAVLFVMLSSASFVSAEEFSSLLERSRVVEADSMTLLMKHYRLEEELVLPQNDRLMVFLDMPHGGRVILSELTLYLDDKPVVTHSYSSSELMLLQSRNTQPLYVTRLPPGPHSMKIETKTMQGKVRPMNPYTFIKGPGAKYVEFQLVGSPAREVFAIEW